ncbi:unnamed protein product [marine sediment metagenome]|uniref:Uncharacterized protein n=1 Tax=marine sediment metagenome TaxID=412755 RepID=X0YSG2_9ZZZZ
MKIIGLLGRIVFWIGLIYIIAHSVIYSYLTHDYIMMVLKLIFFPVTYVIYPWTSELWWVFIISIVGYWASTFLGKMEPVE